MAAELNWQKSLRRRSDAPILKKNQIQNRKRLGSIQEYNDDVFDENINCKIKQVPRNQAARRKLSNQSSVSDIGNIEAKKAKLLQSPAKVGKASSFLKKLPSQLQIPKETKINCDVPSPIPLPQGVFSKSSTFQIFM